MLKKKIDPIPKFKNYKEEAEFWDTHSLADYWDKWKDVDLVFELDKPREASMIFRMQEKLKKLLQKVARRKGLNPSALVRMWVTEKLQEEAKLGNFSTA